MNRELTQNLIKKMINNHGITRTELAQKMGYSPQGVSNALTYEDKMNHQWVSNFIRAMKLGRVESSQLMTAMDMEKLTDPNRRKGFNSGPRKAKTKVKKKAASVTAPQTKTKPQPKPQPKKQKREYNTHRKKLVLKLMRELCPEIEENTLDIISKLMG